MLDSFTGRRLAVSECMYDTTDLCESVAVPANGVWSILELLRFNRLNDVARSKIRHVQRRPNCVRGAAVNGRLKQRPGRGGLGV